MTWLYRAFWGVFLRATLPFRYNYSQLMQWLHREVEIAPLREFESPEHVANYLGGFQYKTERIDHVSDPRHTQWRMNNGKVEDGDCDDAHSWAVAVLNRIPGVGPVYLVSIIFNWAGHATCVFRWRGHWYLMDWSEVVELDDPNDCLEYIAVKYGRKPFRVYGWMFETGLGEAVAIVPTKLEVQSD